MPKYIAKQSVGQFMPGEEIKGLDADRIQALLASGAIEEYQQPEASEEDDTATRLADLEKANAELVSANKLMTDEKIVSDQENSEFKTKVADLEKALTASETALKKLTADTKKAAATAKE